MTMIDTSLDFEQIRNGWTPPGVIGEICETYREHRRVCEVASAALAQLGDEPTFTSPPDAVVVDDFPPIFDEGLAPLRKWIVETYDVFQRNQELYDIWVRTLFSISENRVEAHEKIQSIAERFVCDPGTGPFGWEFLNVLMQVVKIHNEGLWKTNADFLTERIRVHTHNGSETEKEITKFYTWYQERQYYASISASQILPGNFDYMVATSGKIICPIVYKGLRDKNLWHLFDGEYEDQEALYAAIKDNAGIREVFDSVRILCRNHACSIASVLFGMYDIHKRGWEAHVEDFLVRIRDGEYEV